jgi:light-regulated signal transduction histidine kinase (bacteriophytochrome)
MSDLTLSELTLKDALIKVLLQLNVVDDLKTDVKTANTAVGKLTDQVSHLVQENSHR